MEALGALAACVQLLEQSARILQQAKEAWARHKDGISYLQSVVDDVQATIMILDLIVTEKELQLDHVCKAASLVVGKAIELDSVIKDLDKRSAIGGGLSKLLLHFINAQGEKDVLDKLRRELNDSKSTLVIALQMAQVGLIRSLGESDITVNIEVVSRVDQLVQKRPGLEEGLRLKQLLQARGRNDERGQWHLSDKDLDELTKPPPYEYSPLLPGQTRGIVRNNIVDASTFVGMGIGKDGGDHNSVYHPDELIVQSNRAQNRSLFLGGGISAANLVYLQKNIPGFVLPTTAADPNPTG
ncbi:hypothetical protein BGZ61DRAFT_411469 [Ilyonectria robusta]|uniref:uncharacterized protein n=1 Tax=Ilyonectria robusta TaxID=1079257 RepID=UPI001E8E8658|nr:uncharacterized protein BGZ61DRAFT_411469 [Ilyonectria robusta]KAH8734215.1 hypothetical protein BGZ61DRAFT_411469 [Ilyonectria robusta]